MEFGLKNVLELPIQEDKLKCYYIGYDLGKCRLDAFTEVLMDAIIDFAFGYHTGISNIYDRRKLKDAAKAIYGIKSFKEVKWTYVDEDKELDEDEKKAKNKFLNRGEFGELILHTVLRDYFNTIPLLSKIFFKDTPSATVHGFDSVHIGPDLQDSEKSSIYLGESKVYSRANGRAGEDGIDDLINDIKAHLAIDFLQTECSLIAKKKDSFPDISEYKDVRTQGEYQQFIRAKNEWYNFFADVTRGKYKMEVLLKSVTIPLICTYQSAIFRDNRTDNHADFSTEYKAEVGKLQERFESKLSDTLKDLGVPTSINILLILLPIPSKKDLIKTLHQKLYNQQNA